MRHLRPRASANESTFNLTSIFSIRSEFYMTSPTDCEFWWRFHWDDWCLEHFTITLYRSGDYVRMIYGSKQWLYQLYLSVGGRSLFLMNFCKTCARTDCRFARYLQGAKLSVLLWPLTCYIQVPHKWALTPNLNSLHYGRCINGWIADADGSLSYERRMY